MLLFSSALVKHTLTFIKLSDCTEYVPLAAKWAEDKWGYIRRKGIEYRIGVMSALSEQVHIGLIAGRPVAMFALLDHEFHDDLKAASSRLPDTRELMYVYVDKAYRGLGFGRQIILEAKRVAAESGANLIILDTLTPDLKRGYEKHGATVACDGSLFSHPTEVLKMGVS